MMSVMDKAAEESILWNDLVMLIEAQEAYNETYYNSEYKRISERLEALECLQYDQSQIGQLYAYSKMF